MERRRALVLNLAAVALVVLLAVMALVLSKSMPVQAPTPNAGSLEEAGIVFTVDDPAD